MLITSKLATKATTKLTNIVNTCNGQAAVIIDNIDSEYDDWFLPSKDELNLMYVNLHQKGLSNFNTDKPYWSSTEINSVSAWVQDFADGDQLTLNKNSAGTQNARAVRAF